MKVVTKGQTIFSRLSKNASISLRTASFVSEHLKEAKISSLSLFLGIFLNENCLAYRVLQEMAVDRARLLLHFLGDRDINVGSGVLSTKELSLSRSVQDIFRQAYDIAQRKSHVYVGTEHLMLALLLNKDPELKGLANFGITVHSFRNALGRVVRYPLGLLAKPDEMNLGDNEESVLDYVGDDLVGLAKAGLLDPVIDREEEMKTLINVLSRRKKNNPLVIGEAGVGKTVLVEGLAQRIADGQVPPSLQDKKIILLNISSIISGSRMRGDVEEKVGAIIRDVLSSDDNILFIDEIHNIVSPGMPGSSSDIAAVLKPALLQEGFRCIGATTTEAYSSYFESDNGLARRFQPIFLKEASVEDAIQILENMRPIFEKHHHVRIGDEALKTAVVLSDRYVSDRYLPDKAIDLLDEASAQKSLKIEEGFRDLSEFVAKMKSVRLEKEENIAKGNMEKALKLQKKEEDLGLKIEKRQKECESAKKRAGNEVNVEDIRGVVSAWTGIPLNTVGSSERSALLNLEKNLNKSVVGQGEACTSVASAIKRARTGIVDIDRPWSSFLFLGPTGVGKTELAKVLTKELFGDSDRLIQVDMSEMREMHSVSKLIGSPPGYIGYQEGGWLTEKVRRQPHSVLLFDEVEKAHPDVLNVLLQILEYGHLTDGKGRTVNFKNTVVILTSNIGAEEIRQDRVLGFGEKGEGERSDKDIDDAYTSMRNVLLDELRGTLRPELLNRLDDVVIFRSLTRRDARKIVRLLVKELNVRLQEEGVKVSLDAKAINHIVKESFSEEYGARPLRRSLQDEVENLLADYMLENGDLLEREGRVVVKVGVKDGKVVILDT